MSEQNVLIITTGGHYVRTKCEHDSGAELVHNEWYSKAEYKININAFEDLIEICSKKKEIKLKYELEKNVNLVKFEKNRIEISFNESLDKDFVKDLSSKLFEWTGERWIITFSKLKGQMSVKDKEKNVKKQLMDEMKNSEIFKSVIDKFPDAELIDVNSNKDGVDND